MNEYDDIHRLRDELKAASQYRYRIELQSFFLEDCHTREEFTKAVRYILWDKLEGENLSMNTCISTVWWKQFDNVVWQPMNDFSHDNYDQ